MVTPLYELIITFVGTVLELEKTGYEKLLTDVGFRECHWVENRLMTVCNDDVFQDYPEQYLSKLSVFPAGTRFRYEVAPPR